MAVRSYFVASWDYKLSFSDHRTTNEPYGMYGSVVSLGSSERAAFRGVYIAPSHEVGREWTKEELEMWIAAGEPTNWAIDW